MGPAAVRRAAASFGLVRGGREVPGRPAWSARSGLPSFFFTKVSGLSGTLHVFPLLPPCCLTPRSRRGPTAGHQGPVGGTRYILANRALASYRWSRLTSNVRHHKAKPVASPAGSAARCAESQAATARHSREQPASLVHLHGSGQQNRAKRYAPFMKQQVNFPSPQVSASPQAAVALGAGFGNQFLEPAAVRSAVASFCLVRGGRQIRGRPARSARSGLPSFLFT